MRRSVVLLTVLIVSIGLLASSATAVILTPVDANSSSVIKERDYWLVERAAVDHAATFDVATGASGDPANQAGNGLLGYDRTNTTFTRPTANSQGGVGLLGHAGTVQGPVPVATPAPNNGGAGTGNSMLMTSYPLFWDWKLEGRYPNHANRKQWSMWMSARGHEHNQWIEIELDRVAELQQIWIWNWNDGPEVGRAVSSFTLETVSTDSGAGLVNGKPVGTPSGIKYDVNHGTFTQAAPRIVERRPPDWVIDLNGARTRYIRLSGIRNFGPQPRQVGIGPILVFDTKPLPEQPAAPKAAEAGPAREPHWQLFLDNHVIERSTGFRRVLHQPQPRGVVLTADQPWEKWIGGPKYVGWRKDGRLECYYYADGAPVKEPTGYAVSKDGLHWEKPNLGLIACRGSKENNLVPCSAPADLGMYGNVSDPAKRFLVALGDDGQWRMRLFFGAESPDFIGDPQWRDKLVEAGTKPSYKLGIHFWDDVHQDWVFMRQTPNHPPTRSVSRWSTKDLRNWTIVPVLYPDAEDSSEADYFDEVYGMHAIYTEGLVLGYGSWFMGDWTRPDKARFEQELIGRLHMKGPMDMRLVVSRDGGYTWDRTVSRKAWIPHGTEHDSYDRCVILYTAPVRMGDEDWFYCNVMNGEHGGPYHNRKTRKGVSGLEMQGALYTQKHNRYVSLTTGTTPQILITKPVKVTGKTLQLNVDASRGEVKVGIGIDRVMRIPNYPPGTLPNYVVRDREGKTRLEKGFRIQQCEPIRADGIEQNVAWKDAKLEALQGKTVRLYIMAQDADLYGFRFK